MRAVLSTYILLILVAALWQGVGKTAYAHGYDTREYELEYSIPEIDSYPTQVVSCDLGFDDINGSRVVPPKWYAFELTRYECNKQQRLAQIAYYESRYNPIAKNNCFEGLYQIGKCDGGTLEYVKSLTYVENDHDVALWILENYPQWFETNKFLD